MRHLGDLCLEDQGAFSVRCGQSTGDCNPQRRALKRSLKPAPQKLPKPRSKDMYL